MVRLCFFEGVHAIRDDQHVEARAFEKRRETIRNGRVIISEENGLSIVWHDFPLPSARVLEGLRKAWSQGPGFSSGLIKSVRAYGVGVAVAVAVPVASVVAEAADVVFVAVAVAATAVVGAAVVAAVVAAAVVAGMTVPPDGR